MAAGLTDHVRTCVRGSRHQAFNDDKTPSEFSLKDIESTKQYLDSRTKPNQRSGYVSVLPSKMNFRPIVERIRQTSERMESKGIRKQVNELDTATGRKNGRD